MATKEDLSLAQITALVRLKNKIDSLPKPIDGRNGKPGTQGPTGPKGDKGVQGSKGEQGVKGNKGEQGKEGQRGPEGPKGIKGDSGNKIISGSKQPEPTQGDEGDFYVQKKPLVFYGPKRLENWGDGIPLSKEPKDDKDSSLTLAGILPQGDTGSGSATVAVGTTTTGNAGTSASVTNTGTSSAAVFNFTIPRGTNGTNGTNGTDGSDGSDGATGATGSAATIAIGSVSTGAAGSSASVTNVGTSNAAVLTFSIPRGNAGSDATVTAGSGISVSSGEVSIATNAVIDGGSFQYYNDIKVIHFMSKHLDYVEQPDGTFKWEMAEIPAVKSTQVETKTVKKEPKKPVSNKKAESILSD